MQDIPPKDAEKPEELSDDELEEVTGGVEQSSQQGSYVPTQYREGWN